MDRIVIHGGRKLYGQIAISGAKNSALKLLAAALLSDQPLYLKRVPKLADTKFMMALLTHLGVLIDLPADTETIVQAACIKDPVAPYDLVRKMRASFNILGPLLAREGRAKVSLPGGCAIGARPVNLHLEALSSLGAEIDLSEGYVIAKTPRKGLHGAHIIFPMVSVGATEHAILAAVLAKGETRLENCACEPEIADLAGCLNAMGARIYNAGKPTIDIQGVDCLHSASWTVLPDRIESGTYAIAAVATGGEIELQGAIYDHNAALWGVLERAGAEISISQTGVKVSRSGSLSCVDVRTEPFPGFPTDLQAQFMALMTTCPGASVIWETIFENRFMHAPELSRLGANINVRGHEAVVRGCHELRGAPVMATDLRASVSLVIAGLMACGKTVIQRIYHLDRGFENLEFKLSNCGAEIYRESG